jgi:DNA-binding PadR family transcriptional regulator
MTDDRRAGGRRDPRRVGSGTSGPLAPHVFQILLTLADQDRHGLGIMSDVLERTDGSLKLWPGMLYRNLSKLAADGLVVEVETPAGAETSGGRPRFYHLTPLGRRACAAEAERLAGFVEAARRKKLLKA